MLTLDKFEEASEKVKGKSRQRQNWFTVIISASRQETRFI